ncbi:MAG: response regulator transcription factor [Luteolibacter sp.]|uniref:response regulator transcription factor n=1 Tax=Luteolibacter sp. TaxID=1962973 RepID=UPI00326542CC
MIANEGTITVAVVEDSEPVRESLQEILNDTVGIQCVATCASGEEALERLPLLRPSVVFMDIGLPGISGVECVSRLVRQMPEGLIVMLTVHDDDAPIFESLAAGACGYLHKPIRADALVAAVREVHAGGSPMTSNIARRVVQAFNKVPAVAPADKLPTELTPREHSILELLLEAYSYREIAERIGISVHTVNFHIRHIYEKLHVRSRGEIILKFMKR